MMCNIVNVISVSYLYPQIDSNEYQSQSISDSRACVFHSSVICISNEQSACSKVTYMETKRRQEKVLHDLIKHKNYMLVRKKYMMYMPILMNWMIQIHYMMYSNEIHLLLRRMLKWHNLLSVSHLLFSCTRYNSWWGWSHLCTTL